MIVVRPHKMKEGKRLGGEKLSDGALTGDEIAGNLTLRKSKRKKAKGFLDNVKQGGGKKIVARTRKGGNCYVTPG